MTTQPYTTDYENRLMDEMRQYFDKTRKRESLIKRRRQAIGKRERQALRVQINIRFYKQTMELSIKNLRA
jgi:hypothetical protein